MAEPIRRKRRHAAGSARILTAGLSSAAAFGMVAGMAVTAAAGQKGGAPAPLPTDANPVTAASPLTAPAGVIVIRRHWIPVPSDRGPGAPTTPAPTPLLATAPARPAPVTGPTPVRAVAPRPVTRTRSS